jgi:hypothetical protein
MLRRANGRPSASPSETTLSQHNFFAYHPILKRQRTSVTRAALLSLPANAAEVCDRNCVGPLCGENCTRTPDATVGKTVREPDVTVEERRRVREPDVEIKRERRPGVDVEINR